MKYFLYISLTLLTNQLLADAEDCISIKNDQSRLACFDSYFELKKNLTEVEKNNKIKPISDTLAVREVIELQPEIENQPEKEKLFGLPKRLREKDDKKKIVINSIIESVSQRLNYQLLIILENGQHWQSVEKYRDTLLRDGQGVEIREGFFSGYDLRVKDKKIKISVRRTK